MVIRVNDSGRVTQAINTVKAQNHVHTLWLNTESLLCDLAIPEDNQMDNLPCYLEVPDFGPFRKWIFQVPQLRKLQVVVILPESAPESYRNLRILSSLGVPCGILFGESCPDWESLADLMCYYVYGKIPHAPIQPFHKIVSSYDPQKMIDFNDFYFNDPSLFLHIDTSGRVALSRKELENGDFILDDPQHIDEIETLPAYMQRVEAWRNFFLEPNRCALCTAWLICQGKFQAFTNGDKGCREFFTELLEAAEFYQEQKNRLDSNSKNSGCFQESD